MFSFGEYKLYPSQGKEALTNMVSKITCSYLRGIIGFVFMH
jgi:hypothetical protein